MQLAVSALAWNAEDETRALELLQREGVRCIEHIPSRAAGAGPRLKEHGLTCVGFQALLHGTTGLHLFETAETRAALGAHLGSVCRLGRELGARELVFGSPKNRFIPDGYGRERALEVAGEFFRAAGAIAETQACWICLEPNPSAYGCNFLVTTAETAAFVEGLGASGVKLNVDAGALVMNGEDPRRVLDGRLKRIGHVHASEPELKPVGSLPHTRDSHRALAETLRGIGYAGVVSIEMLRPKDAPWEQALLEAIHFTREAYGLS